MALPIGAAALFGLQGIRSGRSLLNQGKSLFKKLNPDAKPMKVKVPKHTQIKTAKPKMINPKVNKVSVTPEEKKTVMGWFDTGYKPGGALQPKANLNKKLEYKDVASGFGSSPMSGKTLVTNVGKQMDKKKQPITVFDRAKANKTINDELAKDTALKLFR